MPNTKSAIKRTRNTERKQKVNRAIKSRIGTLERNFKELVKEGKKEEATTALRTVASAYDKAAKKGVLHRNKANNKKSRLAKLANGLS
jgi:small subunit ribosomal protein S20